ncbi:hypothetical protein [Rickettsia felis]|uniref:hypothetical protein n=1 Tax=Rickettsia felis TaxID=42862 RepID=UPI0012E00345|nr:hypothetical protein [Rickettsia felis]
MREELRSNKGEAISGVLFHEIATQPTAARNDGLGIHATMPVRNDELESSYIINLLKSFYKYFYILNCISMA